MTRRQGLGVVECWNAGIMDCSDFDLTSLNTPSLHHSNPLVRAGVKTARLRDDFLHAAIEIERTVDARVIALGHKSINFDAVPLWIEKIARHRVAHFLVSVAHAVIDRYTQRLETLIIRLDVGRRFGAPSDMRDDLGVALAPLGESELVIFDIRIGRQEHHAPGMLTVLDEPEHVF